MSSKSTDSAKRICVVFVDGLGVGTQDKSVNPLAQGGSRQLLGVFSDLQEPVELPFCGQGRGIDACLGVPGLPQSATCQTALFTGVNAAALLGYHRSGFPNLKLRQLLWSGSILKRAREHGLTAAFVNAYRPLFFQLPEKKRRRFLSATTVACLSAGQNCFSLQAIAEKQAIYHEFTNRELRQQGYNLPFWTPEQAGRVLAGISADYRLCLYEFFRTDHAGHKQDVHCARAVLSELSSFLRAFLEQMDSYTTLVVVSDHGNIEDLSTTKHTRNPAMLAAWGWATDAIVEQVESLTDFTPAVLRALLA